MGLGSAVGAGIGRAEGAGFGAMLLCTRFVQPAIRGNRRLAKNRFAAALAATEIWFSNERTNSSHWFSTAVEGPELERA